MLHRTDDQKQIDGTVSAGTVQAAPTVRAAITASRARGRAALAILLIISASF
jgi:hypothetical protein